MHGNLNQIREDASINLNRCEKHNVISASHKKNERNYREKSTHAAKTQEKKKWFTQTNRERWKERKQTES